MNIRVQVVILISSVLAGCGGSSNESNSVDSPSPPRDPDVTQPVVDAPVIPEPSDGYTVSYEYDDSGRLVNASYSNGGSVSYEFDGAGNIITVGVNSHGQ